ncbi:MAG TPA: recombinase RecT [Thermoanaerobaculia bacterium]
MTEPTAVTQAPPSQAKPDKADGEATLKQFLEKHRDAIVSAAANRISPDRVLKTALIAATKAPLLTHPKMDKISVLRAVVEAASLGLEPGSALGDAYLVPFWNQKRSCYECQLIIGYRGYVTLARRSDAILGIDARPVFKGEEFTVDFGTDPKITHRPNFTESRKADDLVAVYVVWRLKDNPLPQFDVMSRGEVDAVRARSKAKDSGPWVTDFVEMGKKTVVRRSAKLVPMSAEAADALDEDALREFGDFELGHVVEQGTEALPKGGADRLRAITGANDPPKVPDKAADLVRVEALKARRDAGEALSDDELEDIRQYDADHPAPSA